MTFQKDFEKENGAGTYFTLDSGNAIFSIQAYSYFNTRRIRIQQMKLKANLILDIYDELDYDAMNIGWYDLVLGKKTLQKIIKKHNVNYISSNLYDKKKKDYFTKRYMILENESGKIGVIGVMKNDVGKSILQLDEDFEVRDPFESAEELVKLLRDKVDMIVVLSCLGEKNEKKLAETVEGIDIIISGGVMQKGKHLQRQVGNTLIVKNALGGKQVGVITYNLSEHGKPVKNGLQIAITKKQLGELEKRQEKIASGKDKTIPKIIRDDKEVVQAMVDEIESQKKPFLDRLSQFNDANWFTNDQVFLRVDTMKEDEKTLAKVKKYYSDVAETEKNRPASNKDKKSVTYRGVKKCMVCHKSAYDFWKTTRHAKAYKTLEDADRNYDPDCISCHTTGYNFPGGFTQANEVGGLKNVQCEMCHPVNRNHEEVMKIKVKKREEEGAKVDEKARIIKVPPGLCDKCHTGAYKPDGGMHEYYKKINCKLHKK